MTPDAKSQAPAIARKLAASTTKQLDDTLNRLLEHTYPLRESQDN